MWTRIYIFLPNNCFPIDRPKGQCIPSGWFGLMFKKFPLLLAGIFVLISLSAQPVINSFSPVSAPVGTTVDGNNFNPGSANNIIYFGGVKASVLSAILNSLTVIVQTGR